MANHSSILAWKIPWMEEPGRLQSMGSQRVRHDWANLLSFSLQPSMASMILILEMSKQGSELRACLSLLTGKQNGQEQLLCLPSLQSFGLHRTLTGADFRVPVFS